MEMRSLSACGSKSGEVDCLLDAPQNPLERDARARCPEDQEDGQHHSSGADGCLVGAQVVRDQVQHGGMECAVRGVGEHLEDLNDIGRLLCVGQLGVLHAVVERKTEPNHHARLRRMIRYANTALVITRSIKRSSLPDLDLNLHLPRS